MADNWLRILHVSDLHCTDAGSFCLAPGYRRNYFGKLSTALNSLNVGQIDLIVATGDFVDKFNVSGFALAKEALHDLAAAVGIPEAKQQDALRQSLVACCGNHDFDQDAQRAGDFLRAREHYKRFVAEIAIPPLNRNRLPSGVSFTDYAGSLNVVSIDSTLNRDCTPGRLAEDFQNHLFLIERVVEELKAWGRDALPTLVLSHYPIRIGDVALSAEKKAKLRTSHVAEDFEKLRFLMAEVLRGPVLFFYGDVHHSATPDPEFPGGHGPIFDFITGRLDSRSSRDVQEWNIHQAVRIVLLNRGTQEIRTAVLEYEFSDIGDPEPSRGEWHCRDIKCYSTSKKAWQKLTETNFGAVDLTEVPVVASQVESGNGIRNVSSTESGVVDGAIAAIRGSFEERFEDDKLISPCRIAIEPLDSGIPEQHRFDRVLHVHLGPIVGDSALMRDVLDLFEWRLRGWFGLSAKTDKELICSTSTNARSSSTSDLAFIGVDSWGAWLATELGMRCHRRSLGISIRGLTDQEIGFDLRERSVVKLLGDLRPQNIVVLTDVVVTWRTIGRLRRLLEAEVADCRTSKWWAIGVIGAKDNVATATNTRKGFEDEFFAYDGLEIPVLSCEELPHERFLPRMGYGMT